MHPCANEVPSPARRRRAATSPHLVPFTPARPPRRHKLCALRSATAVATFARYKSPSSSSTSTPHHCLLSPFNSYHPLQLLRRLFSSPTSPKAIHHRLLSLSLPTLSLAPPYHPKHFPQPPCPIPAASLPAPPSTAAPPMAHVDSSPRCIPNHATTSPEFLFIH